MATKKKPTESRSALKYYRRDPNNKNRGAGFYYNRTWKDEGFKSNYMSKYDAKRDYNKKPDSRSVTVKYKNTGGSRRFAHMTDAKKYAGKEIDGYRRKLSSDGKYYDTQKKKTGYSKDPTTKYFQKKVGVNKYNKNVKSSSKSKYSRSSSKKK